MKKNISFGLAVLVVLLLQACVPAALVVGAAGGIVISDNRSMQTIIEDRKITDSVQARLDSDRELKAKANISAATFNQIVLVVGQAPTEELRDKALAIVHKNQNIKRVYNEVTIEGPIAAVVRSNDVWLTTKIKTALVGVKGLHSAQLKVVTVNGTVYLMGLISRSQGELAADSARNVAGVRRVVKVFEYT